MSEPDFILRRCSFDIFYNVNLVVGGEEKSEDHQSHQDKSSGHHECLYNMFYQSIWQKWQYYYIYIYNTHFDQLVAEHEELRDNNDL